jgi:hypothetical protein
MLRAKLGCAIFDWANRITDRELGGPMSGFVGVNLIDYEKLTVQQKNRLKRTLRSRKRALKARLSEIDRMLKLVEKKSRRKKKSKR